VLQGLGWLIGLLVDRLVCLVGWLCGWVVRYSVSQDKVSKSRSIPLQAWTGPEGSRRMRIPDLKTVGT
jgi:hypothetical protein